MSKYNYYVDFSQTIKGMEITYECYLHLPYSMQSMPEFRDTDMHEKYNKRVQSWVKQNTYYLTEQADRSLHIAIRNFNSISVCAMDDIDTGFKIQDNKIILNKNSITSLYLMYPFIRESLDGITSSFEHGRIKIKDTENRQNMIVLWCSIELNDSKTQYSIPVTIDLQGDIEVNLPEKLKSKKQWKKDILEFLFYHLIPAY